MISTFVKSAVPSRLRVGPALSQLVIGVLRVDAAVPEEEDHIDGHQADIEQVEGDDIVDVVVDELVDYPAEVTYLHDYLEDYALAPGGSGYVGAVDIERP